MQCDVENTIGKLPESTPSSFFSLHPTNTHIHHLSDHHLQRVQLSATELKANTKMPITAVLRNDHERPSSQRRCLTAFSSPLSAPKTSRAKQFLDDWMIVQMIAQMIWRLATDRTLAECGTGLRRYVGSLCYHSLIYNYPDFLVVLFAYHYSFPSHYCLTLLLLDVKMAIPKKEILVKPVRKLGRALSDGYYGASYIPDQSGEYPNSSLIQFLRTYLAELCTNSSL